MPSLLKKMTSRRRRRSSMKETTRTQQDLAATTNKMRQSAPAATLAAPLSSISIDSSELISPIKSSPRDIRKSPSLALTEATSATFRSSDSWSDQAETPAETEDYLALIKARDSSKHIPPRPSQSRWNEDDFLKVIWVWDLSQDQINKMRELELKLYDVTHWKNNPFEVVRFMMGPLGYKPAERLFRRMVAWRIDNDVDTILQDYTPPPVLMDYVPSAILHGLDHDGDPIYLERAGATDAASLLKKFGQKTLIHHLIWLRELCGRGEWIKDHEERMGRPITQVTIVYDLAGLNSRHMRPGVLPFFGTMMRLTQDYYTGPVKRMVIIRAPSIFRVVWGIVKHFFDPWAVAKMTFSGPNDHEEVLSRFMDLSVLPPCVSPEHGQGYAADGMPQRFEGGIPESFDYTESIAKPVKPRIYAGAESLLEAQSSTASTATGDSFDEGSNGNPRVSIRSSTLGSGFFQMDQDGLFTINPAYA